MRSEGKAIRLQVGIVDVDGKIPNLALMKISAYHKQRGDLVKFYEPLMDDPGVIYASKIFDFSQDFQYFPDTCEIVRGGSGYDLAKKLPEEVEACFPDYSLYNCEYALGRFTRGCVRNCPWCIVPKMDGREVRKVADLKDFWNGQKVTRILDDNILADPDIFADACEQLRKAGTKAIWEALDIRLINDQTARALASVKNDKSLHFAWDGPAQDAYIESGIATLKAAGIKPYRLMFYVLIGFNTSREYDLRRVMRIKELGANPFVMPFDKFNRYQKDFARWCNNKHIFKSTSWENYDCPTNRGL